MCFLEREVYAFCGERVRGAMPWARIFFVYGRAAGAGGGPAADGSWAARAKSLRAEQHKRSGVWELCGKKGRKMFFLFLGGKIRRYFLCFLDSDNSRSAAIAALGYRHRRENVVRATTARGGAWGGKTQLVEG